MPILTDFRQLDLPDFRLLPDSRQALARDKAFIRFQAILPHYISGIDAALFSYKNKQTL